MRTLEQGDLQDFNALQCAISGVLGDRGPDCLQFDNELLPCHFGVPCHLIARWSCPTLLERLEQILWTGKLCTHNELRSGEAVIPAGL